MTSCCVGAADGSLRVFDAVTFELRRTIALAPDTLASIRPLDDGTLLTAGRRGVTRVDPGDGRVLWQHDQGLADIGDGASGATCVNLAVVEQQGTFYCANAYGRLAEHDLSSGYAIRVLDAQNGNSGSLWPAGDGTELVSFGDNEPVVSRWRLDGSGPITHLVAPGFRGMVVQPTRRPPARRAGRGARRRPRRQVIDVASGDVVRTPRRADQRRLARRRHRGRGAHQRRRPGRDRPHRPPERRPRRRRVRSSTRSRTAPTSPTGKERALFRLPRRDRRDTGSPVRPATPSASDQRSPSTAASRASISRTGHRIAAGTERGVQIYDGFTGEQVDTIPGDDLRGVFITVTDQLFVGSLGGELTLYDLDSLQPIRTFGGSRGFITQVAGTADGTLIATSGGDHSVILYDVASGVRIGTPITIPDDESNRVALSLDGRWLSVGGEARRRLARHQDLGPRPGRTGPPPPAASPGATSPATSGPPTSATLAPYRATCPDLPTDV